MPTALFRPRRGRVPRPSSVRTAHLVLAATTLVPLAGQTRMWTLTNSLPNGRMGYAIAAAGDVDADGFGDVLVGAPLVSANAPLSGWAAVYSGRTGAALHVLPGRAHEQYFGTGVCGLGDLDGDGHDDFAVGALGDRNHGTRAGRVIVFSGRTATQLFDLLGDGPGDLFGHAVAPAGDVDADGVPDLVVGAPENGDPIPNYGAGYAKVFSGRTGAVLHHFPGAEVTFEQGHAVAAAGDVDGDGHDDVVVAAVLDGIPVSGVGAVRVYSGRTGEVRFLFRAPVFSDHFGTAVAGVGDVDRDGVPDVGVSAVELASLLPGNVSVFSGRTGQRIRYARAAAASEMMGISLCAVGDLDRDGHPDYATGAPGASNGHGAVLVFAGRDGSLLRTIVGPALTQGAMFAFPLAAGDVNRDGFADFLVGARGVQQDSGAALIYSGVNVTAVGAGCSDFPVPPQLSATTPRVGQNWSLLLQGAPPTADGVLLGSVVPAVPTLLWGSRCVLHLDLPTVTFLTTLRADPSGTALATLPVPNLPPLLGQALSVQAALAAVALPLSLTNGVLATLVP